MRGNMDQKNSKYFPSSATVEHWSVEESKSHTNVLEKKGTLFALKIYCKDMYNASVHFKIDNTSIIVWMLLDKQAESPKQRGS